MTESSEKSNVSYWQSAGTPDQLHVCYKLIFPFRTLDPPGTRAIVSLTTVPKGFTLITGDGSALSPKMLNLINDWQRQAMLNGICEALKAVDDEAGRISLARVILANVIVGDKLNGRQVAGRENSKNSGKRVTWESTELGSLLQKSVSDYDDPKSFAWLFDRECAQA